MAETLGQHLLRRLRRRPDRIRGPVDDLPPTPTASQLEQAMAAAKGGWAADCEALSLLLLATDADAGDPGVKSVAEALLLEAEPALWRSLDVATRRSWWHAPVWAQSASEHVASGQAGVLGVIVASFHPSGYVREAAVARLGELDSSLATRALALRACDWVGQVRDRARAALERRLSCADELLVLGPLAVALAGRAEGRWLAARAEESMAALADEDLARLRATSDWRVRRAAYKVALADDRLDIEQLVRAAQADGDVVVRTRCAEAAIRSASDAGDLAKVWPLTGSRTAAVRAAAISALARAGDLVAATAALPDRNVLVREIAQGAVRHAGLDAAALYRQLVTTTQPADPGALAGLGETGTPQDAALIRPALSHPQPRGRAEAIRALRRLGAIDVETATGMLQDPSAAVTRQAALALRPVAANVPLAVLRPLLAPARPPHVRSAAYRVLRQHDIWTRILADLELYDDENDDLRNRARGDIAGWLSRGAATTYSMPAGATAERLDDLLVHLAHTLGARRERLLRFHLGLTSTRRE